jgi:hypothetical protein
MVGADCVSRTVRTTVVQVVEKDLMNATFINRRTRVVRAVVKHVWH